MKLLFMGTSDFAVPSLRALQEAGHEIPLVVCQPDRPKGRGHRLQEPPLKTAARAMGIECFQPERIRDAVALGSMACDALCVVAYGQLLPKALLELPRLMALNLHASLLPRYRGAAPIEWALARGETRTGVCLQRMSETLDAGGILMRADLEISADAQAPELTAQLAALGADLWGKGLELLESGSPHLQIQDEREATYAPRLSKEHGILDFERPAREVYNQFRAFVGRPGLYSAWKGEWLRIHCLRPGGPGNAAPSQIVEIDSQGLRVACGEGSVWLEKVQSPGTAIMPAVDWSRGRRIASGDRLGRPIFGR